MAVNGEEPVCGEECFVAPNASVIGNAKLGDQSSVWYGAVVKGMYRCLRALQGCWLMRLRVADIGGVSVGELTSIGHNAVVTSGEDAPVTIGSGCVIGKRGSADVGVGTVD